ncbi:MAG: 1-deoxy-D-xylulose-5-phosphate reductoisomerase [Bacteroidetes bacterium]|nr:MAG: 1-deoxy-D-xylulose-5-phosphate reductoisomerase [Bacteroidota bacterium]
MLKKRIAILGSTGSIGKQALEVMDAFPDHFEVEVLTAYKNHELLVEQALKYNPNVVVIGNDRYYKEVSEALENSDTKVYAGEDAIEQITSMDSIDMILMAIVGFEGLKPTLSALENRKPVALANKECLVIAGELITKAALENHTPIIPVDSEHSAIFQCLMGEGNNPIEKIVLTASGGPFRETSTEGLNNVTPFGALNHPNWKMGNKVTVDSATLMNKGLEVMEAKWLFGLQPNQIEVVIHPQSIVHSLVYFTDGNVKAQLGLPDMRLPIQFALSYPDRLTNRFPRLDLLKIHNLTFEVPDVKKFRNLALAFKALKKGGNTPAILNAANEIAVEAFLDNRLEFSQIPSVVEQCINEVRFINSPVLNDYFQTNDLTRRKAKKIIENNSKKQ